MSAKGLALLKRSLSRDRFPSFSDPLLLVFLLYLTSNLSRKVLYQRNMFIFVKNYKRKETLLGNFYRKRLTVSNNVEKKPASNEVLFPQNHLFYDRVGFVFEDLGKSRKDLVNKSKILFKRFVNTTSVNEKRTLNLLNMFEKVRTTFLSQNKKTQSYLDEYLKLEEEVAKEFDMKKRMRKEKIEIKKWNLYAKKSQELEPLKKLAIFLDHKTKASFSYFSANFVNEFEHIISQTIFFYRNFLKEQLEKFENLISEFSVAQKLSSYLPTQIKEVEINSIRPEYKLKEQVQQIGVCLTDVMARKEETIDIPRVLNRMITYIEKRKDYEGLFRQSGSKNVIRKFVKHLKMGNAGVLDNITDVHTMCSSLKEYIKMLPESATPFEPFIGFTNVDDEKKRIKFIQEAIKKLPISNQMLTYRLFKMYNGIKKSKKSKMNSKNLALCMALNTIRAGSHVNDYNVKSLPLFKFIVDNFEKVYKTPPVTPLYEKPLPKIDIKEVFPLLQKIMKRRVLLSEIQEEKPKKEKKKKKRKKRILIPYKSPMFEIKTKNQNKNIILLSSECFVTYNEERIFIWKLEETKNRFKKIILKEQKDIVYIEKINFEMFATSSKDKTVKIWNINKNTAIKTISGFSSYVDLIYADTKYEKFLILVEENKMRMYDLKDFSKTLDYQQKHESKIVQVFESFDMIYSLSLEDAWLGQWRIDKKQLVRKVYVKGEFINYVIPSKNEKNKVIVCLEKGKYAFCGDMRKLKIVDTLKQNKITKIIELDPKKENLIALIQKDGMLCSAVAQIGVIHSHVVEDGEIEGVEKVNDSTFLYWDDNFDIHLRDMKKEIKVFSGHNERINSVKIINLEEGLFIVSCSDDKTIRIWKV